MKPKHKALLFNFIAFVALFLIIRLTLGYYIPITSVYLAVISAIVATILAPKFGVVKTNDSEKVLMKWIFIKGMREI